jgi:hypothetical protein
VFDCEQHESSLISDSMSRTRDFLKQLNWPTLLCGLAMGLVIMQMLVGQQVSRRMDLLTVQMADTQAQMELLVGSSDDVAQANDLLSRLVAQKSQLRAATDTMVELQRLRAQVERDSHRIDKAVSALEKIQKLQSELASRGPQMEQAVRTVDSSITLQSKIAEMSRNLPMQAAGIDEAQDVLTQLAQLKQKALNEENNIAAAHEQMHSMTTLVKGLTVAGDKMLQARTAASELLALKDLLTMNEEGLDRSQMSADKLIALQQQLSAVPAIRVDEARNNMLAMVEMQQKLSGQTRQIAENVENLELMADFHTVLNEQLTTMEGIRRQLTDLVLMESTIARAARVLSPLAEISTIRGLRDDNEVREAARRVLDRRLGQQPSSTQVAEGVKGDVQSLTDPEEVFDTPARPAPTPTDE